MQLKKRPLHNGHFNANRIQTDVINKLYLTLPKEDNVQLSSTDFTHFVRWRTVCFWIFASASLTCFYYAYFKFKMFQTPNLPLKRRSYFNPTQLILLFNGHITLLPGKFKDSPGLSWPQFSSRRLWITLNQRYNYIFNLPKRAQ